MRPVPYLCTLSLHDALPICELETAPSEQRRVVAILIENLHGKDIGYGNTRSGHTTSGIVPRRTSPADDVVRWHAASIIDLTADRSEEHTSELQSRENLVCRL